jgi:hypothetical protein
MRDIEDAFALDCFLGQHVLVGAMRYHKSQLSRIEEQAYHTGCTDMVLTTHLQLGFGG